MRNTPLLRGIFLFIAAAALIFDLQLLFRVATHPEMVTRTDYIEGYWVLPIALIFVFLYSYLNKRSR